MAYYDDTVWWNEKYKVRRFLTFEPDDLKPGAESRLAFSIPSASFMPKVKSNFSDVVVLHNSTPVPFYVINDGVSTTMVIEPVTPILVTDTSYSVYYLNEQATRQSSDPINSNPASFALESFPSEDNTRWLITNPTIDWVNGKSVRPGARAAFTFVGHKCDLNFSVGPDRGVFGYSINDESEVLVDCYSEAESIQPMVSFESNSVAESIVRIRATGEKAKASGSSQIEMTSAAYNDVLVGSASAEQYYSSTGFSILSGNN